MSEPTYTLYVDANYLSPYAMSAFVTLTEKGVPFDIKTIDLANREYLRPDYARLSLTCRVPTLVHGDFHLSESSAISEYLDELLPAPLYPAVYPQALRERAVARQVQAWLRSDFLAIRSERSTEVVFHLPSDQPLSEAARSAAAILFAAVEQLLKRDAVNLFDAWCIADTDLALMLNRLIHNGDPVPERLVAYAQGQWQRPSMQDWVRQARSVTR